MINLLQFIEAIELSLIYSLVSIGVYLTFRVIDFPDLSVDGTFPLGAAISAVVLAVGLQVPLTGIEFTIPFFNKVVSIPAVVINNPFFALLLAFICGGIAGYVTAMLNVKGRIMDLLSGILVMAALYSINLRIMGQPNMALLTEETIFSYGFNELTVLLIVVAIVAAFVVMFLNTEVGLAIRAAGVNPKNTNAQGVNVGKMKTVGLVLSNALVALAGAIFSQKLGFADISMGTGTIIIGLASVIIGEKIFRLRGVLWAVVNCIVGATIYRLAITVALNSDFLGLEASDLNLVTSVMVAAFLILPSFGQRILKGAKR